MLQRILNFVLAITLVACAGSSKKEPDRTLHLNVYCEPPMLDPRQTVDITSCNILAMIGEGLTAYDVDDEVILAGAKTVEVSEDGKLYTFTLRNNFWSDGTPVTAHDYAAAWLDQLHPTYPSIFAYKFFIIKNALEAKTREAPLESVGIKALDDETLQVELTNPCPYFLQILASPFFYPINKRVVENNELWAADAGPSLTSNGPFMIHSWIHDHEMILKPNPYYWDRDAVWLDQIELIMVDDAQTELYLFEQGRLDLAGAPLSALPSDSLPVLRNTSNFQRKESLAVNFLNLNTTIPPLNNSKIRQALGMAIPRESIVTHVLANEHLPAFSLVPSLSHLKATPLIETSQDEKAKQLFTEGLEELGLSENAVPKLTLSYNTSRQHQQLMQAIAEHWMKLFPIKIALEVSDWKVHLAKVNHCDFEIARLGWSADYSDPLAFLEPFKFSHDGPTPGLNTTGWYDPNFIALIDEAKQEQSHNVRLDLLHQAEVTLIDAMPLIPIYFMRFNYLQSERCENLGLCPFGMLNVKHVRFKQT